MSSTAAPDVAGAPTVETAPGLERRIASGAAWAFAAVVAERLVAFTVFALVVRRLAPADVGVVTLASVFVDLSLILTHGGLPEAIVRHPAPRAQTFDTAFWINIGIATALASVLCVLAVPIAWIYAAPVLAPVLWALSASFPLTALGAVHQARLNRSLRFRALSARSMAATLIGGAAALALSRSGHGLWALVAQRLVALAASTASLWMATRWVPGIRVERSEMRALLGFGVRLSVGNLLLQLTSSVSLLIIGAVMNSAAVGYYRVAYRLYDVVNQFLVAPLTQVALAGLSAVQTDRVRFTALYARMTGVVSSLAIAAFFGLAVLAAPAIRLVFGADWAPSVPILSILCLLGVPACVNVFVWPALTARGAAGAVFRFSVVQLATSIVFSFIAAPFGAVAVAIGQVLRAFTVLPYALSLTSRHVGIDARTLLNRLLPPVFAAACMAGFLYLLERSLSNHFGMLRVLLVSVPAGVIVYSGCMMIFARQQLRDLLGVLRT
jgi:PST family polysaccharide transporter